MFSSRKGFTLIELLIVVAIIGILAAIAIPNFLLAQVRAKVSKSHAELASLGTSMELYAVDNNGYIATTAGTTSPFDGLPIVLIEDRWEQLTSPVAYISSIPDDIFGKLDKIIAFRHKIGFTGHFDQGSELVPHMNIGLNNTFGHGSSRTLGCSGQPFFSEKGDRFFHITVAFGQRGFTVHDTDAGFFS